jgi:hypothetical protein
LSPFPGLSLKTSIAPENKISLRYQKSCYVNSLVVSKSPLNEFAVVLVLENTPGEFLKVLSFRGGKKQ